MSDLFVELQSYRAIYDNIEAREKANRIYRETQDLKKVDDYCLAFTMFQKAEKLKESSKLNSRFSLRTFDNFSAYNDVTKNGKEVAIKYTKGLKKHLKNCTNLLIEGAGKVGTGKTHLACAVAHEAMNNGIPAKFINVTSMLAEIREHFRIEEYSEIELLVVDDLGKEKPSEWVFETLYSIINKRYENMRPTIITTEGTMQDLLRKYEGKGKAIISRLSEDFVIVRMDCDDFRLKR